MTDLTPLHEALLELGLEDLIPLPEIRATPEVRDLGEDYQNLQKISTALIDLLQAGRIEVWRGHWPSEPTLVSDDAAETILRDERRYSFDAEAEGLERVYFTNIETFDPIGPDYDWTAPNGASCRGFMRTALWSK